MIWEKLFVWEDLSLWFFKISTDMMKILGAWHAFHARAWHAFHAIAETEWHHNWVVIATEGVIFWWSGNFIGRYFCINLKVLVAMVTNTHSFHFCDDIKCIRHAPEIFILHTSANFEKSKTIFLKQVIFLKSLEWVFYRLFAVYNPGHFAKYL